jgi:SAM-dependent methyltransferase
MKKINEESLSRFSEVPKLLLSKNPEIKWKNHESISREFEKEKWGSLLEISNTKNISVNSLEKIMHPDFEEKPFLYSGDIFLDQSLKISKLFLKESINFLKKKYNKFGCQSVVEIGAGYGRLLIPLADALKKERPLKVIGTDFTSASGKILNNLSKNLEYNIKTTTMDISGKSNYQDNLSIVNCSKPLVFSCQTVMYVPFLDNDFIELMRTWPDGVFCNIEPIYKKEPKKNLEKLQSKYIEVNDYNKNLLELLKDYSQKGLIEIIYSSSNNVSENAFLPLQTIVWRFI